MNSDGVREASEQTFIFVVGLHEEMKVFPGLQRAQTQDKWEKDLGL